MKKTVATFPDGTVYAIEIDIAALIEKFCANASEG